MVKHMKFRAGDGKIKYYRLPNVLDCFKLYYIELYLHNHDYELLDVGDEVRDLLLNCQNHAMAPVVENSIKLRLVQKPVDKTNTKTCIGNACKWFYVDDCAEWGYWCALNDCSLWFEYKTVPCDEMELEYYSYWCETCRKYYDLRESEVSKRDMCLYKAGYQKDMAGICPVCGGTTTFDEGRSNEER